MSAALGASGGSVRFGSLFAGIGGFDLALERAGLACAWQCEIDPAARSVLARHWPDVRRFEDVRELGAEVPSVDVLCGGWPCQDLSVAGNRAGLAGERSGLFREVVRIAALLAPRWLLLENVPGLLSSNGGRDMRAVLWSLGQLGYRWAYRVLDAQHFGVPQRRRRVFIVGSLGAGCPGEVLFEPGRLPWDLAPRGEAGEGVAAILAGGSRGRGWRVGADEAAGGQVVGTLEAQGVATGQYLSSPGNIVTGTVSAHYGRGTDSDATDALIVGRVAHTLRAEGHDASEDGSGRETPLVVGQCHGFNVGEMGHLRRGNGNVTGGVPFIAFGWANSASQGLPVDEHVAPPIRSNRHGEGAVASRAAVRRLTPRECERLQGLPDDWTRYAAGGAEISDSARYRMIGNGVAVPVVEWIARRIAAVDAASREAAA